MGIALVIFLLGGRAPFEAHDTTFERVAISYLVGGIGAGIIVSMLLPLTKWKMGSAIVGCVAAIPVSVVIRFATDGFKPWETSDTVTSIFLCLALGAPTGVIYREIFLIPGETHNNGDKRQ